METTNEEGLVDHLIHVMVVDDQRSMRKIVRQLLHQQGIDHVTEAENGLDAYRKLRNPQFPDPDIIICDLHMDGMDGMELVRQLRKEKDARPILILTGDKSELLHEVTEQVGATKVLTKPISAPDLAGEIHLAIGVM